MFIKVNFKKCITPSPPRSGTITHTHGGGGETKGDKVQLQRHLLSDFHQNLIDINLRLGNIKYKIPLNSVY